MIPYAPFAILLAACLLAAPAPGVEPPVLYKFAFGQSSSGRPNADGYLAVNHDAYRTVPFARWTGLALRTYAREGQDRVLSAFQCGDEGQFTLGLDNGSYTLTLTMFDRVVQHGPFRIELQGRTIAERAMGPKDRPAVITAQAEVTDERLELRFMPLAPARNFILNSLVVAGPPQRKKHVLQPLPPAAAVPTPDELEAAESLQPRAALRRYADFLLAQRNPRGLFSGAWWVNSYPVRTLLAAHAILGERSYLDAAAGVLDAFVDQQLPNGSWSVGVLDKPCAQMSDAQQAAVMRGMTNMADIGSIASCLSVAHGWVDPPRQARYLAAARRFADDYAAQWQLPSGAFSNACCEGRPLHFSYSVATGTEAMNFAALYTVTGEPRYLAVAERATRSLLADFAADGRLVHHLYDRDQADLHDATDFHNNYYYHEGILWTYHHTTDAALRAAIHAAYRRYVAGPQGLLARQVQGVWWPVSTAKAGGMLTVLDQYARGMTSDPAADRAMRNGLRLLCAPELVQRIGVLVDPRQPWGQWSLAATGFAGLSVAQTAQPGVIFTCGPQGGHR